MTDKPKLSRDATTPEEIFPDKTGPIVDPMTAERMTQTMQALQAIFGKGFDLTLFVAEKWVPGSPRLPRFNYMSTADRADMIAVLKAFIEKQRVEGPALDKINDAPPTESKQ